MTDIAVDARFRRSAAVCSALAILPLVQQLPASMLLLLGLLLLYAFALPKPPRWMIGLILLTALVLLLLVYKVRFGRDTAACMLALMLAMKCLETAGMRDLRAVMGFSLFLPFAALLTSQAPLTLALTVTSLLFWLTLGALTGALFRRSQKDRSGAPAALVFSG